MAQKSGFFNALNNGGVYDRKYNANDYTDNLAVVISNGVLRSTADDLKVTAAGMVCTVAAGRAWINGKYYYNDSPVTFAAVTAPSGGNRWDRIFLRLNTSLAVRSISLVYQQGTAAATPTKPTPTRSGDIYDLVLADIYVATNATSVTVTDTRGDNTVCGWVYSTSGDSSFFTTLDNSFNTWFNGAKNTLSSVTLFKKYTWRYVMQAAGSSVQFSIPQWDSDTCFLEVYVNGIFEQSGVGYTLSGTTITFDGTLIAGTEVIVNVYKSIDGTGIMSVSDEITALQNTVATLDHVAKFSYKCTGANDNLSLTQIAQAIYSGSYVAANVTQAAAAFLSNLGGNNYLAAVPTDAHITINVIGTLGVSSPVAGSGTSLDRYKWFNLSAESTSDKRVTFNFAQAERMLIWCSGNTENIIFYGTDLDIRNVKLIAKCNASGCHIQGIAGRYNTGKQNFENCHFEIRTTEKVVLAENGNFTNCDTIMSSAGSHALTFCPSTDGFIRVFGGTHKAYTASAAAGNISAIFYTYGTATNGVIMAYNINCPVVAVSAFYQKWLSIALAGKTYINGVLTTLNTSGNYNEVVGKFAYTKPQ